MFSAVETEADCNLDPGPGSKVRVSGEPEKTKTDNVTGSIGSSSNKKQLKKKFTFVGIHLGAGQHRMKHKDIYKEICDAACRNAMNLLKAGGSADDAVTQATKYLENSGVVNAGRGSNLTLEGTVECDAGFMDGDGYFGGVGSLPGVPNPVEVARKIANVHKTEKLFSGGRVPPNFMVGSAAKRWAESQNIPTCDDKDLISKKAQKRYKKMMDKLEDLKEEVGDTVGAIALDNNGCVASAVSSGGNWLKFPGRIGHSPIFGCGCWSSNLSFPEMNAIAVSTSGAGEILSRVRLPQECARVANDEADSGLAGAIISCVNENILNNPSLNIHLEPKYVGLIALMWDGAHGEFAWGHTSDNFVLAYQTSRMRSAKMTFSELGPGTTPGKSLKVEGILL